jgi:hypothetical protein
MAAMGMFLFFLTLYLLAPAFIARLFQRARWKTIAIAFGTWFGGLVLMGLLSGNPAEGLGWAVILGMFLTVVMMPVIVHMLHRGGFAQRRSHQEAYYRRLSRTLRPPGSMRP